MMSPIPNSLFAGAYNGSFFPHGAVTFSSRSFRVIIRQEICVDGEVVTQVTLNAVLNTQALLDAGFVDQIPLAGEVSTFTTLEGEVITIQALTGSIEEC
jgi:hypothetical protein